MRRRIFGRKRRYRELSESIREHLAEKAEALMDEGLSREEAERRARLEFGNAVVVEEHSREVWQWGWLERAWADARFAWRQMLRAPGITLTAVLTLMLGISANTAIFTLTWNIVLSGLPVPHPERLVVYAMQKGQMTIGLSGPEYAALQERQKSSRDLLAWHDSHVGVRTGTNSTQEPIEMLSANADRILEIQPALGQFFSGQEANGTPAMLSYAYWQSQFGGRQNAIGATVAIDGHPATVIGVMPEGFEGLTVHLHPAVFLPLAFGRMLYGPSFLTQAGNLSLFAMGRLRPGVTLATARAEMRAIEPAVRKEADPTGLYLGQFFRDFRLVAQDGHSGISWLKAAYERPLLVLELLVSFVLALCCLNTALVMMARVSGRQQEYAVRAAMGAGRGRLLRQVLVETLMLTVPGLVGGVFLGWLGARLLADLLGTRATAMAMDLRPNAAIVAVNAGAALVVAFGAGLWPAMRASRSEPSLDLKAGSRAITAKHLGGWAVVLQVAVSLCLVSAAVLLGGTLTGLLTAHSGFRTEDAVVADLHLSALKLTTSQQIAVTSRVLHAIEAQPGVTAAGYIGEPPLAGSFGTSRMFSVDRDHTVHSDPNLFYVQATPGYFAAAGTRVLAGKSEAAAPNEMGECVLSQAMARFFFPHQSAVGEPVYASSWPKPDGSNLDPKNACRVTAVVEDAKFVSLRQPAPMMLYDMERPDAQRNFYSPSGVVVVRARSAALAAAAVREAVRTELPTGADVSVQTFLRVMDQDLSGELMLVSLSGTFAMLALLLTGLGLYGILMRAVTLRRREIGIRIALGADRGMVLAALGRRALMEVVCGLAAGMLLAALAERAVRQLLQEPHAGGAAELLASGIVVVAAAALATVVPVRRAVGVDPSEVLRAE